MSTLAGLCKGPKGEPDALDGVSEGLRAELLTLTSSGSVRLAHWRARRHDVSAELYAWLNREYARLGPYRRGREGEREQHALTRRGLTLEKCRLEDAGRADPVCRSTATRRFHRWTEVEDSPYTGGSIGLALELRNREKVLGRTVDSRRDLRIRYTEPASSPPAGVTNLDQYRTSD